MIERHYLRDDHNALDLGGGTADLPISQNRSKRLGKLVTESLAR